MSADTRTSRADSPLYRSPREVLQLARDVAAPAVLEAFLSVIRERHARATASPIPVPAKPIEAELEIHNPS